MTALIAKFGSPNKLVEAVKALRAEGYVRIDTFTPFPMSELGELLRLETSRIGWIAALSALVGGGLTFSLIWWTAAVDYPLNIGGRPLNSWPAFVPVTLVAAALWSGLATLIGMLWMCGLPRWHHPLFDIHQFDRATYDKFFLLVEADENLEAEVSSLLQALHPEHIDRVRG